MKVLAAASVIAPLLVLAVAAAPSADTTAPRIAELAHEVHDKGWVVFGARNASGDWDLCTMRPDGSEVSNLTRSPEFNEGLPRFSPDGTQILFRRVPREERFDNNRHGLQGQLVVANSDGTRVEIVGNDGEFPWASWSPNGKQVACLSSKGILFYDLATRTATRRLERAGIFQQTIWSPDGLWLAGVANSFGTGWSVVRMEVRTGIVNAVSKVDCCTPDWLPDSQGIVYSSRPHEWTQLWIADGDGKRRRLVYAEDGRHIYGGCVFVPDGRYVLFTGNKEEDGDPKNAGAPMGLMRLADGPTIGGVSPVARREHPEAKGGPVLALPAGWEPHWTSGGKEAAR